MKQVLFISSAFILFFGGTLWYQETAHICPVPITYRLGSVDDRFGLSAVELSAIAKEAATVWESVADRVLFVYDEKSDFPINLIYDERQQQARTEEEWRMRLDTIEKNNADQVVAVKEQSERYVAAQAVYEERRIRYESRLAAYNNEVAQYNAAGGAPEAEYTRLQSEANALTAELRALGVLEDQLRRSAAALKGSGDALNREIETYNTEVLHYNELFGESETFTQGDYQRDRINIYKFSSREELKTVLIHEFGHALGIGHVEDASAIMYHLMTERNSVTLTRADKEAFIRVCGDTSGALAELRRIIRIIVSYFK